MRHNLNRCKKYEFNISIHFTYIRKIYFLVRLGFIVGFTNKGSILSYICNCKVKFLIHIQPNN